ncbi:unnamed protein product [Cuscuta epithymum]|uniref:CUE domain-containing protein n=1 Tax=Cuscuta epithymum TaxID=186058 RepID=A0AAV0E0D3_9ASTE|nr:unnamed protein product [Cuscuta epithymum]
MMEYKRVYKCLQEIFPEIDSRVLRAVSIEHRKDPDAAVEAVLSEVIPFLTERTNSSPILSSPNRVSVVKTSSAAVDSSKMFLANDSKSPRMVPFDEKTNEFSSYDAKDGNGQHHESCYSAGQRHDVEDSTSGNLMAFEIGESDVSYNPIPFQRNPELAGECCDADKCESSAIQEPVSSKVHEKCASDSHEEREDVFVECMSAPLVNMDGFTSEECNIAAHNRALFKESSCFDSINHSSTSIVQDAENSEQLVVVEPERHTVGLEEIGLKSYVNAVPDINLTSEMIDTHSESVPNPVVTRSGHIFSIDLLEDIITEARSNKKNMFAAMESLMCLMKEVELQEKAAEQAKEEASIGGRGILDRVDHLKQMLRHAKEANDMHAGEVHGEKAILATEVKELQSRLLSMADERDRSLAVLDEMRQNLEARLEAAERERQAAELDKIQKEQLAQNALTEQERIMEKVVQEAYILKEEAEENSKLREFLIDRGLVVDMLQGEISVICQDIRLLKEKFDNGVPLSKSFSSSQTSCILASSTNSSSRSVALEPADQAADHTNSSDQWPRKIDLTFPVCAVETGDRGHDKDDNTDEDWEIFDKGEFCM